MPNRTILNKFGWFVSQLHRTLKKKELDKGDIKLINEARIIALLSSNHSWKTFRFLHNGDSFDKEAIREEIRTAFLNGWKEINENDIKEVITSEIDDRAFSMVLTCVFSKEERMECKEILPKMRIEFIDGIEPIENREF